MDKKKSWNSVSKWYDELVSSSGHFYHQNVIFPNLNKWYNFTSSDKVLDLACGQGVLSRHIPNKTFYLGIDISSALINSAKKYNSSQFIKADVTAPLKIDAQNFSHAFIILALQNMKNGYEAIKNCALKLKKTGKLIIVLNHPCFRIPRQSNWQIDEKKHSQQRVLDRYMSSMEIPINMNPGLSKANNKTYSYHHPLSIYMDWLHKEKFAITRLEEWCCPKNSDGKWSKRENRARKEFPLFLAIEAVLI